MLFYSWRRTIFASPLKTFNSISSINLSNSKFLLKCWLHWFFICESYSLSRLIYSINLFYFFKYLCSAFKKSFYPFYNFYYNSWICLSFCWIWEVSFWTSSSICFSPSLKIGSSFSHCSLLFRHLTMEALKGPHLEFDLELLSILFNL